MRATITTDEATARLAPLLAFGAGPSDGPAGDAIRLANASAREWSWTATGQHLEAAYAALGAAPPEVRYPSDDDPADYSGDDRHRAAGYAFHRGVHPLQVEAQRQEAKRAQQDAERRELRRAWGSLEGEARRLASAQAEVALLPLATDAAAGREQLATRAAGTARRIRSAAWAAAAHDEAMRIARGWDALATAIDPSLYPAPLPEE